jgi:YD repeat-containing protein
MTNDGINTLVYDAENHVTTATNSSASGAYVYDGNGLRVQKCVPNCANPTSSTVYIFSGSKVIAEYDNGAAPTAPTRQYAYAGGMLIAKFDSAGNHYYHQDQLSNRMVTDVYQNVTEHLGHFPYGESWYNASGDKLFFTTYYRDVESGNDYAQARTYGSGGSGGSCALSAMHSSHVAGCFLFSLLFLLSRTPQSDSFPNSFVLACEDRFGAAGGDEAGPKKRRFQEKCRGVPLPGGCLTPAISPCITPAHPRDLPEKLQEEEMRGITIFTLASIMAASVSAQTSSSVFPSDTHFRCLIKAYEAYDQCMGNRGDFPKGEWPGVCNDQLANLTKLCGPPTGSFYPKFIVVALLYAPPGNTSTTAFSDSSTSGSSSTYTTADGKTTSYGITYTVSNPSDAGDGGGSGSKGPSGGLTLGNGTVSSQSQQFQTSLTAANGSQVKTGKDIIDHTQDQFFLWLNSDFTPQLGADHKSVIMQYITFGGVADVISISVAELKNPALIPASKLVPQVFRTTTGSEVTLPGLNTLTPADFKTILALDPLASGDPTTQPQDPRYFDTGNRPVVEGPDKAGDAAVFSTVQLQNTNSQTLTHSKAESYSTGISLSVPLGPITPSYSQTDTVTMTTALATTSGSAQQTQATLGSSTVGCCNAASSGQGGQCHLDVYEDLLFQTYAFIPEPFGCSGILPAGTGKTFTHPQAFEGQLLNAQGKPEPNTPVSVKLPNGQKLRIFTDSKGRFSLYESSNGTVTLEAGSATATIEIKNGTSKPIALRQH